MKRFGKNWPVARLEVILQSNLLLRSVVTVWIPPTFRQANRIPKFMRKQNDELNTRSWVVVNSLTGDGKKSCDLRIVIRLHFGG